MIVQKKNKSLLGFELLSSYSDISHFVTTRNGGYSKGTYESFNCSPFTGDNDKDVKANQRLLTESLSATPEHLLIPVQIHGTEIRIIDPVFFSSSPVEQFKLLNGVDALITNRPGTCICVSTADCIPLLIYDRRNKVVAAIHAGWRGTVKNIVPMVLEMMRKKFGTTGEDIIACMGPGISLPSFEVGDEVYEAFRESGFPMKKISIRKKETSNYHIDLWEANRLQCLASGVPEQQIQCAGICTYLHSGQFFSARKLGIKSGRILSGIMINK